MAVWNKPVAWSKFKLALSCPRQLEHTLDHKPSSVMERGWYSELGHAVQKVFELFYNQGLWQYEKTRTKEVFREIARRVLEKGFKDPGIIFDDHLTREMLENEVYAQVESGRQVLSKEGLLNEKMRSEHGWGATFRNLRLYGMIDFIRTHMDNSVSLYDGKGSQKDNADPRQLLYYALVLHASGRRVREAGLIYWKRHLKKVDVSEYALKQFIDGDFTRGAAVFQQLKSGASNLPTVPSKENCQYCSWRLSCKDSVRYKSDFKQEGVVTLGGVDGDGIGLQSTERQDS